jgi:hypothetical protein
MALKDKINDILKHINNHQSTLEYNYRLYTAYEGQIKKEIEDSMRKEILSPAAYRRASQRIPSINILRKGIDKISTVYAEPIKRLSNDKTDTNIMDNIVKYSNLDIALLHADAMSNLQKMSAIEPFVEGGVQKFRVYGGHEFLPYGDDKLNKKKMTVFIKLMGTQPKEVKVGESINPFTGLKNDEASTVIKEVNIYLLYSDNEVLLIDESGDILSEEQRRMGIPTVNEFGIIPQIYINRSFFELVPFPDTSGLDTAILIPKLLADLNYAVQFQSHSIIWVKNAELGNQELNPDTVVDLGETSETGRDPDIGVVTPEVDIQGVLSMVEFELNGYFSSIGIKTSSLNGLKPGREVSGIAKAIDEGDTTLVRRKNIEFFRSIESALWEKMEIIQNKWVDMNLLSKETRKFSKNLSESLIVIFGETKIIESVQDKVLKIQAQENLGVITKERIVKEFNPDFSDEQIKEVLDNVKKQKKEMLDEMVEEMNVRATTIDNGNNSDAVQPGAAGPNSKSTDR